MDFRLEVFVTLARYLNFTQAAKVLSISQPAVTKHIQELESHYGVTLFDRSSRRLSLTLEGKLFLEEARAILDGYEQLQKKISFVAGNSLSRKGLLRIGTTESLASFSLGRYLSDYASHFSNVTFHTSLGRPDTLFNQLSNNEIDLALIENSAAQLENSLVQSGSHLYFPLAKYRLQAVVGRESFSQDVRIALYRYCELYKEITEKFNVAQQVDSMALLVEIIASSLNLVSFIPDFVPLQGRVLHEAGSKLLERVSNTEGGNLADSIRREVAGKEYEIGLYISKEKFRDELYGHFVAYMQRFYKKERTGF